MYITSEKMERMTVIMMGVLDDIFEPEISQENKDHLHDHEGMCVIGNVVITFWVGCM